VLTGLQPPAPVDDLVCPRSETVCELAHMLDQERVVHVRGTPTSGKSVLADLLRRHYLRHNVPAVMISVWPKDDPDNPPPPYTKVLVDSANAAGFALTTQNLSSFDLVFIFDEA
jgi:hypothetical protein